MVKGGNKLGDDPLFGVQPARATADLPFATHQAVRDIKLSDP